MKTTILAISFAIFSNLIWAQNHSFSPEQLQEDYEIFKGAFEEMHPALYWYHSKEVMDSYFDKIQVGINSGGTELDFFRLLSPVVAKIGCGHTWLKQTDNLKNTQWTEGKIMPIALRFINGKAFCLKNDSNDSLSIQPGNEILSINDFSVDSLISLIDKYTPGDGYIQTSKISMVGRFFSYFYTLYIDQPEVYNIVYLDKNNIRKKTKVKALLQNEIESNSKRYGLEEEPVRHYISLEFLNHFNSAKLTISQFDNWKLDGKKFKFLKVLGSYFEKIDSAQIKNLIIDVRDNSGGVEAFGVKLNSYISNMPITGYKEISFKNLKYKYRKYSKTSAFELMVYKLLLKTKKVNDTTHLLVNDKNLRSVEPSHPNFTGNTYILINGFSYSTTGDFASVARSNNLATFVGEETGGAYRGNSGNFEFFITLPNTKILVHIPLARYITNVEKPANYGRGTFPDFTVIPTIRDVIESKDPELKFTLDLIEKSQQ